MTSSAHLQREADAARVGLADTLGQLRDGVAPSALSSEAIALVKDSGLSILKSLADSARANPVPALLIGAGLTMLLTRTTGGDVMGVATSTLKSAAATGVDAARSAASGVAGAASSAASSVAGVPPVEMDVTFPAFLSFEAIERSFASTTPAAGETTSVAVTVGA